MTDLNWIDLGGNAYDCGLALGRAGRRAVHDRLLPSAIWKAATGPRHTQLVTEMSARTAQRFPDIWSEIKGLADGLALPLATVMAWNCRGDLLAHTHDGCTSLMLPGPSPTLAHNEDGLPFLRGSCFLAKVTPENAPDFIAFCYPGSLPGHTFAVTSAGLAQTVNNIRMVQASPGFPRMVLGRAVLYCGSADAAIALLQGAPAVGGFHFALADRRARRIRSVEFGRGQVSAMDIEVPKAHANHALHLVAPGQVITPSSRDRQAQADALLPDHPPLVILHDKSGPGLPILRQRADDPDDENTLASALIKITADKIHLQVFDGPAPALYQGDI